MNVIVMAAGMGKRMKSDLPKVLHPLAGKPLLAHVLDTARSLSPRRLIVVHGHGGERVREELSRPGSAASGQADSGSDLIWVRQDPPQGTGDAVRQAVEALDESVPTLILNGDVPLTRAETLRHLVEAAQGGALGLLTVELPDPSGYGRVVREGEQVKAIVEHKDADDTTRAIREIYVGMMAAPTVALKRWLARLRNDNAQREYYLTDVVGFAAADGVPVKAVHPRTLSETLGVNSKLQLAELERIAQREQADALMEDGVMLADPARIDIRGRLACGRDVSIDVNCVFEGDVTLGDGARIGPNCVIRDSRIGARAEIKAFSHLENAGVGAAAVIGPYARLRPGAELADEVHIGNFVEVKASTMGRGSKANHLSYIGDARVGAQVNIGAGTITCNYDGANKHVTVIEDRVHIGSDVQLVAPVTVGAGADVGAGTTVWKDVPPGTLVVNPKSQAARSDWKRPVKAKKE